MVVINLWGAPGAGKSTTAAGLFFLMKINKLKVELVTEFAKELVWDRHEAFFGDQVGIFAEQNHRLHRLMDHGVDFVITDSPLPLPILYKPLGYLERFDDLVMEQFHRYNNLNFLLEREHSFEAIGRRHDEREALVKAQQLETFLLEHRIEHEKVVATPQTPQRIFENIHRMLPTPIAMPLA